MVLEVVSNSSVRQDTQELVEDYFWAGIPEYWLVDARGETPVFEIHGASRGLCPHAAASWRLAQIAGSWSIVSLHAND